MLVSERKRRENPALRAMAARPVEGLIAAAKKEDGVLLRTGRILASYLAWTQLAGSSSAPARPWLDTRLALVQVEERPPPRRRLENCWIVVKRGSLGSFVCRSSGPASLERSWPLSGLGGQNDR